MLVTVFRFIADGRSGKTFNATLFEHWLQALAPNYYFPESTIPDWLLRQISLSLPEDNRLRQWIVQPIRKKGHELKDNQAEYEQRYRPFRPALFKFQLHYYQDVLEQARLQGSQLLIVNMPLTEANLRLLPLGVYKQYLSQVRTLAEKHQAHFLDLNDGHSFSDKDFSDPVHLNGSGAIKFMNTVAKSLYSWKAH